MLRVGGASNLSDVLILLGHSVVIFRRSLCARFPDESEELLPLRLGREDALSLLDVLGEIWRLRREHGLHAANFGALCS